MSSPTKTAQLAFSSGKYAIQMAKVSENAEVSLYMKSAISELCWGLEHMSIGLRATYMLIEELQREIRQLKQSR